MQTTPPPPNLSGSNYRETFAYLCSQLPPPPDDTPPEASAKRERRAMDAVVALRPMDAFEARLAARIVAMDAHAADSLRLAGLVPNDPMELRRCRAQAASMARQSDAALRTLSACRPRARSSWRRHIPRRWNAPATGSATSRPPRPNRSPRRPAAAEPVRHRA